MLTLHALMLAPAALAPQDSPFAEVRRPVPVIESSSNGIRAVDLGDLDGDGAIDAVVATFTETVVLLNEGVGTFVSTPATLPGGFVRLADVDGDLDADVILWGNPGSIQINDGSGNFSPSPGTLPAPSRTCPTSATSTATRTSTCGSGRSARPSSG